MKNVAIKAVAGATLAMLGSASALADTKSFGFVYPALSNPGLAIFEVSQFDSSLGTLNSIQFTFNDTNEYKVTVDRDGAYFVEYSQFGGQFDHNVPGLNSLHLVSTPVLFLNNEAGPGSDVFNGSFSKTTISVLSDSGKFAPYMGTGKFEWRLNTATYADGLVVGGGVLGTTIETSALGSGFVIYNYAPVPEPETYAMMLAGLAGLVALRARRKA